MKSSTKLYTQERAEKIGVGSWSPPEFEMFASSEIVQEEVERLLGIFKKPDNADISKRKQGAILTHPGQDISDWMPPNVTHLLDAEEDFRAKRQSNFVGSGIDAMVDVGFDDDLEVDFDVFSDDEDAEEELVYRNEVLVNQKLAEAQQYADAIIEKANADAEAIRKEAYEKGHSTGYQELESAIEASKAILDQVASWRDEMFNRGETDIIELVKQISVILFSEGFELDQQVLQQTISNVLIDARALGDLRVYVNPEDAKLLDPSWRDYQSLLSGQQIQIYPTEAIKRGGCYIEGKWGSVDAQVDTQLKAVIESLTDDSTMNEDEDDQLSESGMAP